MRKIKDIVFFCVIYLQLIIEPLGFKVLFINLKLIVSNNTLFFLHPNISMQSYSKVHMTDFGNKNLA